MAWGGGRELLDRPTFARKLQGSDRGLGASKRYGSVSKKTSFKASDLFYKMFFRFTYCLLFVFLDGLPDKDLQALFLCSFFPPMPCDSWEKGSRSFGARRGLCGKRRKGGAGDRGGEWSGVARLCRGSAH